jgi:ABC-type transporter MlaC component
MRRRITLLVSALAIAFSLTLGRAEALQAADPSSLINNLVAEAIANIADRQAVDTER